MIVQAAPELVATAAVLTDMFLLTYQADARIVVLVDAAGRTADQGQRIYIRCHGWHTPGGPGRQGQTWN